MSERPPEFVDLEEEEDFEPREQPAAIEGPPRAFEESADAAGAEDDSEPEPQGRPENRGDEEDDPVGRAAAVLKYIVERIVDDPAQISIGATSDDRGPVLLLSVAEDDRGKVIGRQGRIVQAIRTIVKAATVGTGERVSVEIVD